MEIKTSTYSLVLLITISVYGLFVSIVLTYLDVLINKNEIGEDNEDRRTIIIF